MNVKMGMKIKLLLFSFAALAAPMLIVLGSVSIILFTSAFSSQQIFLEKTAENIKNDIDAIKKNYLYILYDISNNDFLIDKLSLFSKYWQQVDTEILNTESFLLEDDLMKYVFLNKIQNIAIYRKSYDNFKKVVSIGDNTYIPNVLYLDVTKEKFGKINYNRISDVFYLDARTPIYNKNEIIGIVVLQEIFDSRFFSDLSTRYGVNLTFHSHGNIIFSSIPGIESYSFDKIKNTDKIQYDLYIYNDKKYNIAIKSVYFGDSISGHLLTSLDANALIKELLNTLSGLILIIISCTFIAVFIFYMWGNRLIKTVRNLVSATHAISSGNYDYKLIVNRSDELGVLSDEFNGMMKKLKQTTNNLKKSNIELSLMNSFIDAVFQSLLVNAIVIDNKFNVIMTNQSAKSIFNPPQGKKKKLSLFSVPFFKDREERIKKLIQSVLTKNKPLKINQLDIDEKIFSIDFFPVSENKNTIIIILVADITEYITIEKALIKSEKHSAVGQLATEIVHEIGNPISIILHHIQLMANNKLNEEEESIYIQRIESEIKRISLLVKKLLHYSRDETSNMVNIYINELVKETLELFKPKLERKNVKLLFKDYSEKLKIRGNVDLLKQVIINILNNSVESIKHEQGLIEVITEKDNDYIYISIKDNGNGIDKKSLEKIFEPYFTKKTGNNTGLGLSLSYKIMKNHGGDIIVESIYKKGSMVKLCFPKEFK